MTDNKDPIVISCNILEREIRRLIESGRLKADVTFLSSKLHYDPSLLEKALKRTIEKSLECGRKNIVVIYGDVCLGFKFEMHVFAKFGDPDLIFSAANGGADNSGEFFSPTFDHQVVLGAVFYCYPESVFVLFSPELEAF